MCICSIGPRPCLFRGNTGILAGMLYLYRAQRLLPTNTRPSTYEPSTQQWNANRPRYTYQRGTWGGVPQPPPQSHTASAPASHKHGPQEDQEVQEAIRRSLYETAPYAPSSAPSSAGVDGGEEDEMVREMMRRSAEEQRFDVSSTGTARAPSSGGEFNREEMLRKRLEYLDPAYRKQK